jgi:primosomal protein N' (replication factor Y)
MELSPDMPPTIAKVIVDVPTRALSEPFDYLIPAQSAVETRVGVPVVVSLRGRPVVGYVVGFAADSPHAALRSIDAVVGEPLFGANALALASWIAEEYAAPLSEALKLFLPPGGTPRIASEGAGHWSLIRRQMGAQTETLVELTPEASEYVPRANAASQRAVLSALASGPVTTAELAAELGPMTNVVRRLEQLGVVVTADRRTYRRPASAAAGPTHPLAPSSDQQAALDLVAATAPGGVVLLQGVTGSGKTEVYIRAIERVIANGGDAIVLVPEIALTPQTVGRFRARFGDAVAVIHSRLSVGERFDQWELARSGMVRVVVGPRSALFAPLANIKLVVLDEEHEPSYKQNSSPRYHARAVAEELCRLNAGILVLGSATPSMEALAHAEEGRYARVRLTSRPAGGSEPSLTIVDMTSEFAAGNRSMFSHALTECLQATVAKGEKAILFLNRRGFASFLLCRECGFVPQCESCSVSLTAHDQGETLVCHHCGAVRPSPVTCPRCGSAYLRRFGGGTQRAESELAALIPQTPIVRMDADTTRDKAGHERALSRFASSSSGVLLGTQMIAKGLDFPDVTLVGVLNADTSMHIPDFRAAERTYQLLKQVAGRTARGERGGGVVIQTYWPQHLAIRALVGSDPEVLYAEERNARAELGYPPFGRIANFIVSGPQLADVKARASATAEYLKRSVNPPATVLGPAPAPLARVRRLHRWHVLLKCGPDAHPGPLARETLAACIASDDTTLIVDIDPVSLM